IATGIVTTYTYDFLNRLTGMEQLSAQSTLLKSATYVYDMFGRRIAKAVSADGVQLPVRTTFVYDRENTWADFDASGNVAGRYLYGDGSDDILARYVPGQGLGWYLTDDQGSVRDIANAAGTALLDHLDYDSFGNIVAQSNPAAGDRFAFTGREFDA